MTDIDNLDRLPTKFERILAAAVSLIIFVSLTFVVIFCAFRLINRQSPAPAGIMVVLCVLTALATWAAYMFVRIIRGTPKKPNSKWQLAAGVVTTIVGAVSLGSLVFTAIKSGNDLPQSAMPAIMLLVCGVVWSHRAWKQYTREA